MARIIDAFTQFFDNAGDPLVNGWLYFTESGTNNTEKDTYSDPEETTPNENPLQLDASGRCPNVYGSGIYRVTSFYSDAIFSGPGTQIQQFDPVGPTILDTPLIEWDVLSVYSINHIVLNSTRDEFYRSLVENNQGNDPTLAPTKWERIEFISYWNAIKIYALGDIVKATDGSIYYSLQDSNSNKDPFTNSDWWASSRQRMWDVAVEYGQYETVAYTDGTLYRSLIANNVGYNPYEDDGSKWLPVMPPVAVFSFSGGSQTLEANAINEITDSLTYTLPAADSVRANDWLVVEITDKYRAQTPMVQCSGTDTISDVGGTDTQVLFNMLRSTIVRFISNGVDDWRM